MITSPVITPAGGANHHIEVLAIIPANVPGSIMAAVMTFLLGITHSVAHSGPIVALPGWPAFPSSPHRLLHAGSPPSPGCRGQPPCDPLHASWPEPVKLGNFPNAPRDGSHAICAAPH
ncbi:hypothetical protein [Aeromonas sp. 1HA1]|uniref:hypothetical protein n=1 Tax=Aeromonas sp. 1HA1 TaxID=2699193 RepID=UPI0023DDBC61|nr:hypothetical protein [Aeromonas sp. 1HA1]MDF2412805.1 hypothetical protein [Aeromonas sp. 1HA1]